MDEETRLMVTCFILGYNVSLLFGMMMMNVKTNNGMFHIALHFIIVN
jgi:hypothetical protein